MEKVIDRNMRYIFILLTCAITACRSGQKMDSNLDTPFVSVVKLISAESTGNFSEATYFLDVESTYRKFAEGTGKTPKEIWTDMVLFRSRLGKDKKFTSVFPFYKYEIKEKVNGMKAVVVLQPIQVDSNSKQITYELELVAKHWVVKSKNIP